MFPATLHWAPSDASCSCFQDHAACLVQALRSCIHELAQLPVELVRVLGENRQLLPLNCLSIACRWCRAAQDQQMQVPMMMPIGPVLAKPTACSPFPEEIVISAARMRAAQKQQIAWEAVLGRAISPGRFVRELLPCRWVNKFLE